MNALKFGEGYIVYNSQPKVKIAIFDDGDNLVRIGTQGEWADAHEAAEDTGMNVLQRTPNVPEIFWT